jgi:hypothetical protein
MNPKCASWETVSNFHLAEIHVTWWIFSLHDGHIANKFYETMNRDRLNLDVQLADRPNVYKQEGGRMAADAVPDVELPKLETQTLDLEKRVAVLEAMCGDMSLSDGKP